MESSVIVDDELQGALPVGKSSVFLVINTISTIIEFAQAGGAEGGWGKGA